MNTIVISAYPCCGKTYAYEHLQNEWKILDSDSSKFSWMMRKRTEEELDAERKAWLTDKHLLSAEGWINRIKDELIKVRNPEFPNNYINYIKENLGKVDFIFVSSHLQVRQALADANIPFATVYPELDCLDSWVGRMYRRGSDKNFISFQIAHWFEFQENIMNEPHGEFLYRLRYNEYLSEYILKLIKDKAQK